MKNCKKTKQVEKSIWYDTEKDTYYVSFSFESKSTMRNFPSLEDAREYRDAINKAKLEYKIARDTRRIRIKETEEISKIAPYPYSVFEIKEKFRYIDNYFIDNFEQILEKVCSPKEVDTIHLYFRDKKTLKEISETFFVSTERVRQIIAKAIRRIESYMYFYPLKKQREEDEERLDFFRKQLIELYKKNGVITDDIEYEFGEIHLLEKKTLFNMDIKELDLTVRSYNCLIRIGVRTVLQLCQLTESELKRTKNLGNRCFNEIKNKVLELGLSFAKERE